MPQRPAALLFDLDGTLVDTIELIMRSMEFAFADFNGPRPTRGEWLEGLGITLRVQMATWARTPEEFDWLIARYRLFQGEHQEQMTAPYPRVPETLEKLHAAGHPMAIVTSKYFALANRVLADVEFTGYFDVVIGGDSIDNPKPHPDPVLKALRGLGVSAGRALMIGDSPHDIRAGNAAGVGTVAALWGPFSKGQLEPAFPTHWLGDITGLVDLAKTS
jgi:pyrophosphatase PpaX